MSQQAVSAGIIQNSTVGLFTQNRRNKYKSSQDAYKLFNTYILKLRILGPYKLFFGLLYFQTDTYV